MKIKIFDTFTGLAGFSLALESAIGKDNIEHIGFSEIEETPLKVLKQRYPKVKNY
jgi:site-specific DNA-cytosine methylase